MAQTSTREIYVFDAAVPDLQKLLAAVPTGQTIIVLESGSDGVLQLANTLAGQTGLDAIHIFSHGSVGSLTLGSSTLNQTTLASYNTALAQIGSALSDTGDLLLYGCNVAQGDVGQDFIARVAAATGADVAASTDLTGATSLGGDWVLEQNTGRIEATGLAPDAYQFILPAEAESNDTRASANPLVLGASIAAALATSSDVDYFALNVTTPGLLTLKIDQPSNAYIGTITVSLENSAGLVVGIYTNLAIPQNFQFALAQADTYYARITTTTYFDNIEYGLTATFAQGTGYPNEIEQNDTQATATPITLATASTGNVSSATDIDYYSFESTTAGLVTLDLESHFFSNLESGNYRVALEDADGTVLAAFTSLNGAHSVTVALQHAATYYARVSNVSGTHIDRAAYGITVTQTATIASGYESETNDTRATANTVQPGSAMHGQLHSFADVDYFHLSLNTSGTLSLAFDGARGTYSNFSITVEDAQGKVMAVLNAYSEKTGEFSLGIANAGTYFVHVNALSGNYPYGAYTFNTDFISGTSDLDLIQGLSGYNVITGGVGNDRLVGRGTDGGFLYGGAGNDTLSSYANSSYLFGNAGDDTYLATDSAAFVNEQTGEGTDTVVTSLYSYSLYSSANVENLTYTGNTTFYGSGNSLSNTITSGAGNDFLNGYEGADTLIGGAGDDFYQVDDIGDSIVETLAGGMDSVQSTANTYTLGNYVEDLTFAGSNVGYSGTGNASDNTITGGSNADQLRGLGGNDTLNGYGGNDTLSGGTGFDVLNGGAGDDTYILESQDFQIIDDSGNDTAIVSTSFVKVPTYIENVVYTNGAQALPYWIDALLPDQAAGRYYKELLGPAQTMYYTFPTALPAYNTYSEDAYQYSAFNGAQKSFAVQALNYIASVVGITFVETGVSAAVNTIAFGNNAQASSSAYAYYPYASFLGSDVFLDNTSPGNLAPADGQYAALVLIHELGHALGLEHPFVGDSDAPYLTGVEDSTPWTVMSYTQSAAQYHLAYSPLDIAALQYLYGVSSTARAGNDTYSISTTSANFVWDGAGIDTLSASGITQSATLYLEAGYWGYIGAKAATIISAGQVTVNFGSTIENLIGGLAGDTLWGSALANSITGGAGNDSIDGGSGIDTAVYSGLKSAYTITKTATGYTVSGGTDGTDTLTSIEKLRFSNFTLSLKHTQNDFDGDGKSDILWRNTATGVDYVYYGANDATGASLGTVADLNWKIAGTGDFDGDGKADILWRNASTGANSIWKAGNIATLQVTESVADLNWKIAGTGDFDGDNLSDILWRNASTGANSIWKSGNIATLQATEAVADLNWTVAGTGDFDADGKADILWRNTSTGANTLWKAGNMATLQAVTTLADLNWKVAGTADFDGDGATDILWRNAATGANQIWKSGNSATQLAAATVTDLNWKVVATGDFDADDKADILWRNSATGTDTIWKGADINNLMAVATVADPSWKVAPYAESTPAVRAANDFDGDGKSDLLWRNTSTGANTIWKSGNIATLQTVDTVADQAWQVAAVGDFNGDGKADIVWRNSSTGVNYLYHSGNAATGAALGTVSDQSWKIAGAGDFDGDGKSDLLWRNTSTGANAIWKSGNVNTLQAVDTIADPAWQVAAVGDFNGDGKADIVWRNSTTGVNYIYNSGNAATGAALGAVSDQAWKIVGAGDFDGDGKSDLLWRNTSTGANTIWKSGNINTLQTVDTIADQAWQVASVGDFNGDGKADILWRNSTTGVDYVYNSGNSATGVALATLADFSWNIVDSLESGDLLTGGNGNNSLFGTINNDFIYGAAGSDTMTGGLGADTFRYLNSTEGNDSIADFLAGVDKLQVTGAGFGGLAAGALNGANFVSSTAPTATAATAQFLYDSASGQLSFDTDGTGSGVAVNLVTLVGHPALTAADIVVV